MTTLYITEFADTSKYQDRIQIAQQPPVANQTITISGSSAQSSAFNPATKIVRLETDSICSVLFGTNPTATTSTARMQAGDIEYFGLTPGQTLKVAVITNT